jgi:hypothetical protein
MRVSTNRVPHHNPVFTELLFRQFSDPFPPQENGKLKETKRMYHLFYSFYQASMVSPCRLELTLSDCYSHNARFHLFIASVHHGYPKCWSGHGPR